MPKRSQSSLLDTLATGRLKLKEGFAEELAVKMGDPPDAEKLTRKEEIEAWWFKKDISDLELFRMAMEGKTAAEITMELYPYRLQLIQSQGPEPKVQVAYAKRMAKTERPPRDERLPDTAEVREDEVNLERIGSTEPADDPEVPDALQTAAQIPGAAEAPPITPGA